MFRQKVFSLISSIARMSIITLETVIPIPLKEKILQRRSGVWNTNVQFKKGDRIKIKAPSGTGKTTLLHTVWKLRSDYSGNILYDNKNLAQMDAQSISVYRREKLSVIFQDLRLFANLTARENIELKRVMFEQPYHGAEMINQMAAELGVSHVLDQEAGKCSYGEQQRIAIIRALMQPFDLLLMDEPFSHLDQANIAKAARLIGEECAKRRAGFVLADLDDDTHFDYTDILFL